MSDEIHGLMCGVPVDLSKILQPELSLKVPFYPKPGYTIAPCDKCGERLWIGPKQTEMYAAGTMPLACPRCAADIAYDEYDSINVIDLSEEREP